jgi:hypothetical protein
MIPDLTGKIEPKVAYADMGSTMFDYVLQNNLPAVVLMKGKVVNIQMRTSTEPVSLTISCGLNSVTAVGAYSVSRERGSI